MPDLSQARFTPVGDAAPLTAAESRAKWGHLNATERQELIHSKAESNAKRRVDELEDGLNRTIFSQNPQHMKAHFTDKHAPDIDTPLNPNPHFEGRAIDGRHPRTGDPLKKPKASHSSRFDDWRTMFNVLNEATTREARGLPRYNAGTLPDGRPITRVVGYDSSISYGQGYDAIKKSATAPQFNPKLHGWTVNFDQSNWQAFYSVSQ
jgi:hypothetical protein